MLQAINDMASYASKVVMGKAKASPAQTPPPNTPRTRSRSVDTHETSTGVMRRLSAKHAESPDRPVSSNLTPMADARHSIEQRPSLLDSTSAAEMDQMGRLAKDQKNTISKLCRENEDLKRQVQARHKSERDLEVKLEACERDIRSLQSQKLRSIESTQWAPLAISTIQHEISSILSSVRQWSQAHTSDEVNVMADAARVHEMRRLLVKLDCIPAQSDHELISTMCASKALSKPAKAAAFLLSSIASSFLLGKVLGDPLFLFLNRSLVDNPDKYRSVLCSVHDHISKHDDEKAEALRCDLIRSLSTTLQSQSRRLTAHIAQDFMRHYAQPFVTDHDPENAMCSGLEHIVERVVGLAWQVWTRKARLHVSSWSQLAHESTGGACLAYSSDSDNLELHSIHGRDIDDDAKALDGYETSVICSPVVIISGDAEGKNYNKQRVAKKAVVWIG